MLAYTDGGLWEGRINRNRTKQKGYNQTGGIKPRQTNKTRQNKNDKQHRLTNIEFEQNNTIQHGKKEGRGRDIGAIAPRC